MMEIKPAPPILPQVTLPVVTNKAALSQRYPIGQLLMGLIDKVTPQSQNRPDGALYQLVISVEGKKIQVQSQQLFSAGQQVKLEVMPDARLRVLQITLPPVANEQHLVQQSLREILPIQQSPTQLLNRLIPLQKLLHSLTQGQDNRTINRLAQRIEQLLTALPQPAQLTNPRQLKQAVANNGSLMEAKLLRLLQPLINASTDHKQTTQPSPQSAARQPSAPYAQPAPGAPASNQSAFNLPVEQALNKDVKAQLLQLAASLAPLSKSQPATEPALLSRIIQAIHAPAGQMTTTPQSESRPTAGNLPQIELPPALQLLLQQAGIPVSTQQRTFAVETWDLTVSTLLRQIAASIAKIQTHQLSRLTAPQGGADSPVVNSWQLEIPVLQEGQVRPIWLEIEERRNREGQEHADTPHQGRQWKITLGFDFAELGEFFATLTVVDERLSATFWSERPATLAHIQGELKVLQHSLEEKGLQVTQLDCRAGKPPQQETRLEQQLVDIKT